MTATNGTFFKKLKRCDRLRRSLFPYLTPVFLLSFCGSVQTLHPGNTETLSLTDSRQALVVPTSGWKSNRGEAQLFERERPGAPWEPKGLKMAVNVGRKGLGWGLGLYGSSEGKGPIKQEGDGKSPAGVFRIGSAFGYAPRDSAAFIRLPYISIDAITECVDDPDSDNYNLIVSRQRVSKVDWNSSEQMLRRDQQYKWGAVIEHNSAGRLKRGGSCIFLHIWEGPSIPTNGCTSFAEEDLIAILRWLRPEANPVLVQLPQAEYLRLRDPWKLP
jgi:D-alanyl-D-alanine dipeptidase